MTTIYDQLEHERELAALLHANAQIAGQARPPATQATTSYDQPDTTQEGPVNLAAIEQDIRNGIADVVTHAEELVTKAKTVVEDHLPGLAAEVEKAQNSPIAKALEDVLLSPEDEMLVASFINRLAHLAAEHAPPASPDEVPADQPPAEPAPVPAAGPVVGGTAR